MGRLFSLALALLAAIAVAAGSSGGALAQKRVALVIGNSAYEHTARLANPRNDATDIAVALKRHGITVIEGFDLDKAGFERKVREFATALRGADAGIFFFAGHGLQVNGQNYLVPVDAKADGQEMLEFEMMRVGVIQGIMEQLTKTNILFLDAGRNNPLARSLSRSMGTRSTQVGHGLSKFESGLGTLISFSTAPDTVAQDGTGRNSPYAGALVRHVALAEDDLAGILVAVRSEVILATKNEQVPWENSALIGKFYFGAGQMAGLAKPAANQMSEAAEAWAATERANTVAAYEGFVACYKDTYYADLAKTRIDELKKQASYWSSKPLPPLMVRSDQDGAGGNALWVKLCERTTAALKDWNGKEVVPVNTNICMTMHERLDANNGSIIVAAGVRQIEGRTDQQVVVTVPLGVLQQAGLRVSILSKDQYDRWHRGETVDVSNVPNGYIAGMTCYATGCTGELSFSAAELQAFKTGAGLAVSAVYGTGNPTGLSVQLTGFDKAYSGPPVDNKAYAEARKKLMEQIAARQQQNTPTKATTTTNATSSTTVAAGGASGTAAVSSQTQQDCAQRADKDLRIKACGAMIAQSPKDALAYLNRGAAYHEKGERARAIPDYNKAIELNPASARSYHLRGLAYYDIKEYDRAVADLTTSIQLDPKIANVYGVRGVAYSDKGDQDRAVADFSKAIEIDPKLAMAYNSRGLAQGRKGKVDLAIADFNKAIELNPADATAYFNRSIAHAKKGNQDRAKTDRAKAEQLDPKYRKK